MSQTWLQSRSGPRELKERFKGVLTFVGVKLHSESETSQTSICYC